MNEKKFLSYVDEWWDYSVFFEFFVESVHIGNVVIEGNLYRWSLEFDDMMQNGHNGDVFIPLVWGIVICVYL